MCGPKPRALRHSLLCAPETSEERAIIFTPLTEGDIVAQHQELCLKWVASSSQGGGGHVLGGSPLAHSRGPCVFGSFLPVADPATQIECKEFIWEATQEE